MQKKKIIGVISLGEYDICSSRYVIMSKKKQVFKQIETLMEVCGNSALMGRIPLNPGLMMRY